jgi:hypothetical protein
MPAMPSCNLVSLQDFAEAEHAHERFLHALVTQSFLSHQILGRQLSQVFGQSSALCRLVRGARERGIDWQQVQVRGWCMCEGHRVLQQAVHL